MAKVSDTPWSDFTEADYTPAQWKRACLIDTGRGSPDSKDRYKLPVREPDGTLNRNGIHAAAGGHGISAVQGISMDMRRSAARKLVGLYRNELGEDPPESLMKMAGMGQGRSATTAARPPVSDWPWGLITEAEYSPPQWRRACLVDTGVGDVDDRRRFRLAIREPDGALNREAVHDAAGPYGIGSVRGITSDNRQKAARELVGLYRDELGENPPDSLMLLAGLRGAQESPVDTVTPLYRTFTPDLQIRSGPGADGRTVYGIAVPWNAPVRIDDTLVEQFARGAFSHQLRSVPRGITFEREHVELGGTLVGALTMMRDDASGLYVELRASRTRDGDETLELIKDGALDQLSIKFHERVNRQLAGGITERVKAHLSAVAVTREGAYGELAAAAGVRTKQTPVAAEDLDLRAQAERYLGNPLPDLPDHDLAIRAIRLGMPSF